MSRSFIHGQTYQKVYKLGKIYLDCIFREKGVTYGTHESIKKKTNIVSLTSSLSICQRTSSMGYGISRRELLILYWLHIFSWQTNKFHHRPPGDSIPHGGISLTDAEIWIRTFIYFDVLSHLDIYWVGTLIRYSRVINNWKQ